MIRAMYGATTITRVSTGSTSASQLSHGREPGGTVLMAGSTCSTVVANTMTSTRAETRTSTRMPSRSRRTMKPPTPPSLSLFTVACPAGLAEVDRAETVPEAVQVEGALAGLEPLDLGRVAVDEVSEERDDVAAD